MEIMDQIGRKYPKCPNIYLPKLSAEAHNFGILMKKKMLHCASVVRVNDLVPLFLILDASPIGTLAETELLYAKNAGA